MRSRPLFALAAGTVLLSFLFALPASARGLNGAKESPADGRNFAGPDVDGSAFRAAGITVVPIIYSAAAQAGVFEVTDLPKGVFNVAICQLKLEDASEAAGARLSLEGCRLASEAWLPNQRDAYMAFRAEWLARTMAAYEGAVKAEAALSGRLPQSFPDLGGELARTDSLQGFDLGSWPSKNAGSFGVGLQAATMNMAARAAIEALQSRQAATSAAATVRAAVNSNRSESLSPLG
jgi:hypothetical protein